MNKIITILGTRPEITKLSPLIPLLDKKFRQVLIHTGQHYDANLDTVFFRELGIRAPDRKLKTGSATHGQQTARMLTDLEKIISKERPVFVLVQGDTNSAFSGALAAVKLGVPVVHVEAGCRSFNRQAPEEINRILIDHMAEFLIAPDRTAKENLAQEGIRGSSVFLSGNTSLDATKRVLPRLSKNRLRRFKLSAQNYALATVHRAETTNQQSRLSSVVAGINRLSRHLPIILPLHPRTQTLLKKYDLRWDPNVMICNPLGPLDFLTLLKYARFALTDSGGVQEEAAVLNTPCLILREETEWVRLVKAKKNFLVGTNAENIYQLGLRWIREEKFLTAIRKRRAPLTFGASNLILQQLLRKFG